MAAVHKQDAIGVVLLKREMTRRTSSSGMDTLARMLDEWIVPQMVKSWLESRGGARGGLPRLDAKAAQVGGSMAKITV